MHRSVAATILLSSWFALAVPGVRAQAPAQVTAARELMEVMQIGPTMTAGATAMIELQVQQNPLLAPYRQVMLEWAPDI